MESNILNNKNKGEAIKELRLRKNWSQKYLSNVSGISQSTISKVENGTLKKSNHEIILSIIYCFNIGAKRFEEYVRELTLKKNKIKEKIKRNNKKKIFKVIELDQSTISRIKKHEKNLNSIYGLRENELKIKTKTSGALVLHKKQVRLSIIDQVHITVEEYLTQILH